MTLLDGLSVKKHDVMIYFFSLSFFFFQEKLTNPLILWLVLA